MVEMTAAEVLRRVIEPHQFVADPRAFVDVRIPRSKGKASYSFIGPGVSQNSEQEINLREPHGFNVGAASLPAGAVNNAHLHFTAEVFFCTRGSFRFTVGLGPNASHIDIGVGDVLSVPTWSFRSFENIGSEEGWVYVVLGHNNTGGIVWAPEILAQAAETGLHLTSSGDLIDLTNGGSIDDVELLAPMDESDIAALRTYSDSELRRRTVRVQERQWSSSPLLSGCLEGHQIQTAPLIGHGFTQEPNSPAPIADHHSFTASWLRAEPGQQTGWHSVAEDQVVCLMAGQWEIEFNGPEHYSPTVVAAPLEGSIVSLPAGVMRNLRSKGNTTATMAIVTSSDSRPSIEWTSEIIRQAKEQNRALDHNGCIGAAQVIERKGGPALTTKSA